MGQFSSVPFCASTIPTLSHYRRNQGDTVSRNELVAQRRLRVIKVAENALVAVLEYQVLYKTLRRKGEGDTLTIIVNRSQDAVHVDTVKKNHENRL